MPYLDTGRGLKLRKKRRFHYRRLMLFLANTHDWILKSLPGLQGDYEIKTLKHRRDLIANFQWTEPLDKFSVEIKIHEGLDRLKGLLISGSYGDVYGYQSFPVREGSFEYSLTWSFGYMDHFDPYYYYSYDYPYFGGYYGGYFQVWDIDQAYLILNCELDTIDQEEYDLVRWDKRIRKLLNERNVWGSTRSTFFNYAVDLKRIKHDYDKNEWLLQIQKLKEEGREGELETTTYHNLDMGVLAAIDSIVCPEII